MAYEVVRTGEFGEFSFGKNKDNVRPTIQVISEASSSDGATTWVALYEEQVGEEQVGFFQRPDVCSGVENLKDIAEPMIYIVRLIPSGANDMRFIRVEREDPLWNEAMEHWNRYRAS